MSPNGCNVVRTARMATVGVVGVWALVFLAGRVNAVMNGRNLAQFQDALRLDQELEYLRQDALQRSVAKRRIVHEMIDGSLTVRQAAERYATISEEAPQFSPRGLRQAYEGQSDHERWRRCVIECARMELQDQPDEAEKVLARLTAELQAP